MTRNKTTKQQEKQKNKTKQNNKTTRKTKNKTKQHRNEHWNEGSKEIERNEETEIPGSKKRDSKKRQMGGEERGQWHSFLMDFCELHVCFRDI